jgi:hypothetical protein
MESQGEMVQDNVYRVSHTFGDLSPSSDYEVTMYAHNEYGTSREARVRRFHINGGKLTFLVKSTLKVIVVH